MLVGYARSAWKYRNFILAATRGELKARFANSRIGALWFILQPLAMSAIYAIVLSEVLGARLPGMSGGQAYAIYLIAGVAAFSLFQEITQRSMLIFIEYSNTLKKIAFPRIALPFVVLSSATVTHTCLLLAILIVVLAMGHYPSLHWLAIPIGYGVLSLLGLGLGLLCGVFNVFARDVGQFMGVVLQLWFWMTPIVYPVEIVPERFRQIVEINPVTHVVRFYQDIILMRQWPDFTDLVYPAVVALVLLICSVLLFRRASSEMVDVL